jgi:signal transduction histidine kinase
MTTRILVIEDQEDNRRSRRVKQIFLNLVENAIKFSPTGGPLTATARRANWSIGQLVNSSGPVDRLLTLA